MWNAIVNSTEEIRNKMAACCLQENGVLPKYSLSDVGRHQATEAGHKLMNSILQHCQGSWPQELYIYTSPFSRTRMTAALLAAAAFSSPLNADPEQPLHPAPTIHMLEAPSLRERFFGASNETKSDEAYKSVWQADEADPHSRPGGNGESVAAVAARLQAFLSTVLDASRPSSSCHVIFVAHGDVLQILQATVLGTALGSHRQHAMVTAEVRRLPLP